MLSDFSFHEIRMLQKVNKGKQLLDWIMSSVYKGLDAWMIQHFGNTELDNKIDITLLSVCLSVCPADS